jgi:nitrogen fixation NifU-like protein
MQKHEYEANLWVIEVDYMYSDKVMEHFQNPRNVGEIEDADGVGTVGNPTCGDLMTIYIKVKDDKIEDIKFKTFGCGAAIATSSMVTEMAMGKTIDEAMEITRNDVAENLEGLPPVKMHCSNLAADALHAAIDNYREKKGETVEKHICTTCEGE